MTETVLDVRDLNTQIKSIEPGFDFDLSFGGERIKITDDGKVKLDNYWIDYGSDGNIERTLNGEYGFEEFKEILVDQFRYLYSDLRDQSSEQSFMNRHLPEEDRDVRLADIYSTLPENPSHLLFTGGMFDTSVIDVNSTLSYFKYIPIGYENSSVTFYDDDRNGLGNYFFENELGRNFIPNHNSNSEEEYEQTMGQSFNSFYTLRNVIGQLDQSLGGMIYEKNDIDGVEYQL